jgi:hypothetical protein
MLRRGCCQHSTLSEKSVPALAICLSKRVSATKLTNHIEKSNFMLAVHLKFSD